MYFTTKSDDLFALFMVYEDIILAKDAEHRRRDHALCGKPCGYEGRFCDTCSKISLGQCDGVFRGHAESYYWPDEMDYVNRYYDRN